MKVDLQNLLNRKSTKVYCAVNIFYSYRLEFFNDLYHRFLLSPRPAMKAMCLQAMAIVYGQCYEEIGPFNDTPFIVHKLEKVSCIVMTMPKWTLFIV